MRSPDEGIIITTTSTGEAEPRIAFVSASMAALTGYAPQEMIGQGLPLLHLEAAEMPLKVGDQPVFGAVTATRKTGEPRSLDYSVWRLANVLNEPQCHAWIYSDGNSRREAGRRVTDTVANLQALLENSIDKIIVVDAQWRLTYLNRRAIERIGPAAGAVLWEAFPEICGTVFEVKYREAVESSVPVEFEAELRGSWFHVRATPYDHGLIVNYRDVTTQKHLESQLLQAQKMEAIGMLAGGIAHDFNNLLTVINGYSQRLLGALHARDPLREDAGNLLRAGERAADLTRQLLAFSRRQVLQARYVDLHDTLRDMASMLRRLTPESIEVNYVLCPEPCVVLADPTQIEQVILNLVVNAIDAMPEGGTVTIELHNVNLDESYTGDHADVAVGAYVQLVVTDTGMGMSPSTRDRIFEPFFTTKEQGRGTGLGLATVYGIVRQSGGNVWVYSEIDEGTAFKIYLPKSQHAITPEAVETGAPVSLRGGETILLVEDDQDVRVFVSRTLRDFGYRVLTAGSGGEAMLAVAEYAGDIHLLITDVVMPRMSGRELAEALAPHRPEMKVLYCSGYTENVIAMKGILDSGVDYLPKPFSGNSLGLKVLQVLSGPKRQRSIVVVDDQGPVRKFIRETLERAGYLVHEGRDGAEAIALSADRPVDLLLTDLLMPVREGIETIQFFRKERPHIPIIAMSGGAPAMLGAAELLGARSTIQKPIDEKELLKLVKSVIG